MRCRTSFLLCFVNTYRVHICAVRAQGTHSRIDKDLSHQQYHPHCRLLVSVPLFSARTFTLFFLTRNEEAGHYLTTYKQFEFKSPSLIKERVEKDYHSILRSTLTSISKVNKTDVETLRMNFGVSTHHNRRAVSHYAEFCKDDSGHTRPATKSSRIRTG